MPSLFDKPIAANPMSNFVALPLSFIDTAMQRRQSRYDTARAEIDEAENTLMQTKFLPGDAARNREIQGEFDSRLDSIVESVGGDYSQVLGQLDTFKRSLKKELAYGELGSQNLAYVAAMKFKEGEDKKLADGKSSEAGYALAMQSIGQHVTSPNDQGTFNTFGGYRSSTVTNPLKALHDSVDEINAKYTAEGGKRISRKDIISNLSNTLTTNTGLNKALRESWSASGSKENFATFQQRVIEGVVSDKRYEQVLKTSESGRSGGGTNPRTLLNVGQPSRITGTNSIEGGSVPLLRQLGTMLGMDSTKQFDDSLNSAEGRRLIKYMEWKTDTTMPTDFQGKRDWIMENANEAQTSSIITGKASSTDRAAVTNTGFFNNPSAAMWDIEGNQLDADTVKGIQGKTKEGNVARVVDVVKSGGMHPPGTLIVIGVDGEQYFQEQTNQEVLRTKQYNVDLLGTVMSTGTGELPVKLHGDIENIPSGDYIAKHDPTRANEGYHDITLYRNGVPVYIYSRNPQGVTTTGKIKK